MQAHQPKPLSLRTIYLLQPRIAWNVVGIVANDMHRPPAIAHCYSSLPSELAGHDVRLMRVLVELEDDDAALVGDVKAKVRLAGGALCTDACDEVAADGVDAEHPTVAVAACVAPETVLTVACH